MGDGSNAKIGEQHLLSSSQQHIFWFDIAVDEFLLMSILQGISDLLDRGDDDRERDQAPFGIAVPQRAIRCIVDHEKGHAILYIIIEDTHDAWMHERGNGLRFLLEVLGLLLGQMGMQYLDGRLLVEPHMLSEVDLSIATLSQQADQSVVAKLLPKSVCHLRPPHIMFEARMKLQVDQSFR
jgi:hypothetical protein